MLGTGPQVDEPQASAATIFDVGGADFETRVIAASMQKPVIVDFWAPWCGPCKQLMPVLESAVQQAGGEVLLAKVNLDDNQDLAQALRVQSVPTVFAFFGGRPVDAFQGVQPESAIKEFIDKLVQAAKAAQPGAVDIPETLKIAAQALAENDLQTAQGLYAQILQQDERNAKAYAGMLRVFIHAGAIEQAQGLAQNVPEDIAKNPDFMAACTALEMAVKASDIDLAKLEKAVSKKPKDHQAKIDLAEGQFALNQKEQAIETLLDAIATDPEWNDQAARKSLLTLFEALGHSDPLTAQGRKKLSSILFS